MAVQISFCGYNENTTVHKIREDFSILETAEKIVKKYRPTSSNGGPARDGRTSKFDAIMALILNGDGTVPKVPKKETEPKTDDEYEYYKKNYLDVVYPKKDNNEKDDNDDDKKRAPQNTWARNLCNAFGIKQTTPTPEIKELINLIGAHANTYTLDDVYCGIEKLPLSNGIIKKKKDSVLEFLSPSSTSTSGGTQMSNKNKNCNIDNLIRTALRTNKQVIFTGAPGTGKTYAVRNYVEKQCKEHGYDESHYKFVQFHPSYDYTDFVEGLRPVQLDENGAPTFVRLDGIFKAFCRQIVERNQKSDKNAAEETYYFIIDEINRADLAKVFGELMFGLEEGYRGEKFDTQYQNLPTYQVDPDTKQVTQLKSENDVFKDGFYIPENLYIIGTMNDIDRSVDSIDFALRRRFAWVEIKANDIMETSLKSMLKNKLDEENVEDLEKRFKAMENIKDLAERINAMNEVISGKKGEIGKRFYLTEAYHIGPAYFKNVVNAETPEEAP